MRRPLIALSLVVASMVIGAAPVIAIRPTIGFRFVPVTRVLDTRSPGGSLASGVEYALALGTVRPVVDVTLLAGTVESWLYVHDCGTPPDRQQPAANQTDAGQMRTNLVPIEGGCITRYGDAHVLIDVIADEDGASGLNYVAHPVPVALGPTPVPGGMRVLVRDAAVPAAAQAVAMDVTVVAPKTGPTTVSAETCDTGTSLAQAITALPGVVAGNLMILPIDAAGNVCLRSTGVAPTEIVVSRHGYLAPGVTPTAEGLPYSGFVSQRAPGFTAVTPERMFDTRDSRGPLVGGEVYRYRFTSLPAEATAVAMNVTVTQTGAAGFVSAYPCDGAEPEVSNVNFTGPGQTVPNFAIVSVGSAHEVCFLASAGTHLLADLSGYFAFDSGSGFVSQTPARWFDTRQTGLLREGTVLEKTFPTAGSVSAVVMNVTVTQPDQPGFATVYPCDASRPTASNLNFMPGQTRPNLVTVRLPADGRLCFYSSANAHVLADVAGAYSSMSEIGFIDEDPWRLFDTREPAGSPALDGMSEYSIEVGDPDVEAVAWNMTATQTSGPGFVTLYPCGGSPPDTSNLNYGPQETVANFAIVRPGATTEVCMFSLVSTHLIADEAGVFTGPIVLEVYYEGAPADADVMADAALRGAPARVTN